MRSAELRLDQYDSDKIANRYLEYYDPILQPWLGKEILLLELGVHKGGSVLLWRDYFPLGTIVGIDIDLPKGFRPTERIHLYEGSQGDTKFLSRVAKATAPSGFDIIIDDASHMGALTKIAFWHLFDHHLKAGGLYVIEDWGTGYCEDWPDGRSLDLQEYARPSSNEPPLYQKTPLPCHSYGLVGFVKQLVDEQAAHDVTRRVLKGTPERQSKFESMLITPSIIFIKKAGFEPCLG